MFIRVCFWSTPAWALRQSRFSKVEEFGGHQVTRGITEADELRTPVLCVFTLFRRPVASPSSYSADYCRPTYPFLLLNHVYAIANSF